MNIVIDETFLETFGSGSLIGHIMSTAGEIPKEVTLTFPQSSFKERQENGGPNLWLINEFVIPAILSDVISLVKAGIKVEIIIA